MYLTRSKTNLTRKSIQSLSLLPKKRQPRTSFKIYNFENFIKLEGEIFPIFGKSGKSSKKFIPVTKFENIDNDTYLCVRKFFYETKEYSPSYFYYLLPQLKFCDCSALPVVRPEFEAGFYQNQGSRVDSDTGYESDSSNVTLPIPGRQGYQIIEE